MTTLRAYLSTLRLRELLVAHASFPLTNLQQSIALSCAFILVHHALQLSLRKTASCVISSALILVLPLVLSAMMVRRNQT